MMDPHTGQLYELDEAALLDEKDQARLVRMEGSKPDLERISSAVNRVYIKEVREKARAKNKRAKASRRRNRR